MILAFRASAARELWARLLLSGALAFLCALLFLESPTRTVPTTAPPLSFAADEHLGALLPSALVPVASVDIGASEKSFWVSRPGGSLIAHGNGIQSTFTAAGAAFATGAGSIRMSLSAVGDPGHIAALSSVLPSARADQVSYRYGALTERYANGPYGLEQSFTVPRPQASSATLVLDLSLAGSLKPEQQGARIVFETRAGVQVLTYSKLSAFDAMGRRLPARMQLSRGNLRLEIDASHARYPVTIDPFIQQGEKLTATGEKGAGTFGNSVALSANGDIALIGAPLENAGVGAVYAFTRSGKRWKQGEKLSPPATTGSSAGHFGWSIALSANGDTALIGAPLSRGGVGSVFVFNRSGSSWTQGQVLAGTGEQGDGAFGESVALSANGQTALIGGPHENNHTTDTEYVGAAFVFTASGSSWTQQAQLKLTGGEAMQEAEYGAHGYFGSSVALSGDGSTALIGADGYDYAKGAAFVFTRSGSSWAQQGARLAGSGEVGEGAFGQSTALSADGDTALIGAYQDGAHVGSVFAFARSGSSWRQQGEKLTGKGESGIGAFGCSIALSATGERALIGGCEDEGTQGAAWLFERSGSKWSQQGEKLTPTGTIGTANFGSSIALSANGKRALIGGRQDAASVGAAWVFEAGKAPKTGPKTTVTIEAVVVTSTAVLVRVEIPAEGVITVSGQGFKSASKTYGAGVYEFRLPLTKAGKKLAEKSTTITVAASLKTATGTVSTSKKVKL